MNYLYESIVLLNNLSAYTALLMTWLFLFTDMPRYLLCFIALLFTRSTCRQVTNPNILNYKKVSVIVIGYNEGHNINKCIKALRSQSLSDIEIIVVSDGSTDDMAKKSRILERKGLIDKLIVTHTRCGKSAGTNLACRYSTGDIIINIDCDCSLDSEAFAELLRPFSDPKVGAVCSDLSPRNGGYSVITAIQAIEYFISITFGKETTDMLDQISCASGALSAFRRKAILGVGGCDVGGGEDLDLTIRLRRYGWKIRFAVKSRCYTDVPNSLKAFAKQRMRWERDAVRIRFYKHYWYQLLPFRKGFISSELFHQLDFFLLNFVVTIMFPFYLIFMFHTYGEYAIILLLAFSCITILIDVVLLLLAVLRTNRYNMLYYLPYIPIYNLFNTYFMKPFRFIAYMGELCFVTSKKDNYVPEKVRKVRE